MNETHAIEKATADAFISLYNAEMGTTYAIIEYSDAPDVRCKDSQGNALNLEITLTEDRPRDIQAALGRSDHKSHEAFVRYMALLRAGKASPFEWGSSLNEDVLPIMVDRIKRKLNMDYGPSVALVVRDASPLDWTWSRVAGEIKDRLAEERNPFDAGIWVISYSGDKITRLV